MMLKLEGIASAKAVSQKIRDIFGKQKKTSIAGVPWERRKATEAKSCRVL